MDDYEANDTFDPMSNPANKALYNEMRAVFEPVLDDMADRGFWFSDLVQCESVDAAYIAELDAFIRKNAIDKIANWTRFKQVFKVKGVVNVD